VPVAGLLKHLAESTGLTERPGMYDDIPMILKYIVGWAFGNACQQYLVEYKAANPGLCVDGDCTMINIAFSTGMTFLSATVILVVRPASKEIECGDSDWVNWLEDLVEDILQMVIRAFEVAAMVLWYYTCYNFTHLDLSTSVEGGFVVRRHIDLYWAFTMTLTGAMCMVLLESTEQNLKRIKKQDGVDEDAPHWSDGAILFSDVLQSIFGWVTGCAWSDLLFETATSLSANPTIGVIFANLLIVCTITVFACYWLVMNTSSEGLEESLEMSEEEKKAKAEAKATDRGEVEKAFFSGTLGFFVLGGWLSVTRNLFTPFALLVEQGVDLVDSTFGLTVPEWTGDTIAVLVFAPVFTVLSFNAAGSIMASFSKKAGLDAAPKGKAVATEKDAGAKTLFKRQSSSVAPYDANYKDNYSKSGKKVSELI